MSYAVKPARPHEYQKEGVLDMEDFGGRALLADEMGLGKTLQALWLLRRQRVGQTFPALVVCPAAMKYTWEHEAAVHVNLRAQVLEGTDVPRKWLDTPPRLTIINYDILRHWLPRLKEVGFQAIVFDECQFLQNPRSKRSKAARALVKGVPHLLALSGTPLTNRPAELWAVLNMLRPDLWPSFFTFAQEFCEPRRKPWGWEYKGASNLPRLHTQLRRHVMVRRLKADVLGELPDKVRRVVPMAMSDPDEYREARDDFRTWLKKNYRHRHDSAIRAESLTQIGYLLRLAARLKCRDVVRWANDFLEEEQGEKLVLFGVHRKMLDVLERRVHAKAVRVDGQVTGRRRQAAVDQFQKDPATRLFVGNIKAAGVGLTLTASANLAFTEMFWVPAAHTQAEDRIHRVTQKRATWINYLVAGGTIEERLCRIVQDKQETVSGTLDRGRVNGSSLSVYDQLMEALRAEED